MTAIRCRRSNIMSRRDSSEEGDGAVMVKAEPGPPMMLGNAAGCSCSPDRMVPPLRGATRLRRVPGVRPSGWNPSPARYREGSVDSREPASHRFRTAPDYPCRTLGNPVGQPPRHVSPQWGLTSRGCLLRSKQEHNDAIMAGNG
jgi:hypothetical protein